MADTKPVIIDVFAAAGLAAHETGVLPDALDELSVRLDLKGAGPLLDDWCAARARLVRRRNRWARIRDRQQQRGRGGADASPRLRQSHLQRR